MIGAGGVSPDPKAATVELRAVLERLIKAQYDESPVDRYPQEGPLAAALIEGLAAAGFAVVQPSRYEYTLGWLADTGIWCPFDSRDTHPWLSFMQEQLATHDGDPDWEGVVVLGRPVFAWTPAASFAVGGLPVGEETEQK